MAQAPVTKFVGENSNDLLGLALLNQSVVDNNVLLPGETKKIGVAVSAALAAIDDVEFVKGELELLGEILNVGLELAFLQGRKFVEQWQDSNGVNRNHEDLKTSAEHPEVIEELAASLLNDGEETGKNGRSQNHSQQVGLDHIRDEELRGLLVESKLLLQNKCLVDVGRERDDLVDEDEGQNEHDRLRDFAGEPSGCEAKE